MGPQGRGREPAGSPGRPPAPLEGKCTYELHKTIKLLSTKQYI